jgi:hypothetical protein
MSEAAKSLSIGSILGGGSPWSTAWNDAIRALTIRVANARKGVVSPVNVNIVFHVPGDIIKPDFEGVRTGSFSKKMSLLMIQVALPEAPPEDIDADLQSRVMQALDEAERWARKRHMADNLSELKKLVS